MSDSSVLLQEKRGYLDQEFRLFHLSDSCSREIPYHYHDFHKILILLKGSPDYIVEGRSYRLTPGDIVLVRHHALHKPLAAPGMPYERIILYVSPAFLERYRSEDFDPSLCFRTAREHESDVLRPGSQRMAPVLESLSRLETACGQDGYGNELYCRLLFLEFMVRLNRAVKTVQTEYVSTSPCSEKVMEIMRYISAHPQEDFTIDSLASRFYLSKYHMMRLFREETGYTIGSYINEKRLLTARELLRQGASVTEACYQSGFRNYAAFLRACKKAFGETPRNFQTPK